MLVRIFIVLITLFISKTLIAQKDTVTVGVYVTNLYDFDLGDGSYIAEFWTWALYKNDRLNFETTQEITNSKKTAFSNYFVQKKGEVNWAQKKCTTQILQDWNVRHFPFDKQHLKINIEDATLDTNALIYVPDIKNSKVKSTLDLDEWQIDSFITKQNLVEYNTTYGDPTLDGQSVYPAICSDIYLTRQHSWITFFKLVVGVYVAFFIALMAFRLLPPTGESRLALAVGGLFAAVGNKYIVESVVPTSTQATLIDLIHFVTFIAILAVVVLAIWIGRLDLRGEEQRIKKLDARCMLGVLFSYILINILLIALSSINF
jgi:Neurotransmitter-gated ion-channel ligand binding domain